MRESNELFELCKHVYEATGWETNSMFIDDTPRYTSDYLLEKLQSKKGLAVTKYVDGGWNAHCERKMYGNAKWVDYYEGDADTPLKALLKLTLKLHEEGLL